MPAAMAACCDLFPAMMLPVPVQQDATASTQFLERAFHQLLSLLVTLVEVMRVLRQLLNVEYFSSILIFVSFISFMILALA